MSVRTDGEYQDFCDKCLTVVKHVGTPKGKFVEISGNEGAKHQAYAADPEKNGRPEEAVIMCTDIFGLSLNNNLLIADAFAENGVQCYIPDYLNGDAVPEDIKSNPERAKTFSMQEWRTRHSPAHTRPALDALIRYLQQDMGIKKIYAIGYCFGARSVMDLILEGSEPINKAAFAHPSQLRVPDDFERLVNLQAKQEKNHNGKRIPPILFLTCENDPQFPLEAQSKADETLEKLNVKDQVVLYKRVYYAGNDHGFAVRGDISKEHVKKAKEDAFKQALDWFSK